MRLAPIASLVAAGLLLGSAGCATTGLQDSWVAPGLTEMPRFEKLFLVYLGDDATERRVAEDTMAKHVKHAAVVKGYELYPDEAALDRARIASVETRDALRAAGCDGAVVMRLARIEQEVSYAPGAYPVHYHSFGSYWGRAYPVDLRMEEIVHVETNVYSLADDRLLYAARSETFEPDSTAELVEGIAEAIMADLEEKGLR